MVYVCHYIYTTVNDEGDDEHSKIVACVTNSLTKAKEIESNWLNATHRYGQNFEINEYVIDKIYNGGGIIE